MIVRSQDRLARAIRLARCARGLDVVLRLVATIVLSLGCLACNTLLDNEEARLSDEPTPMTSDPVSAGDAGASEETNQSLPDTGVEADVPAPCTDPKTCPCKASDATLTAACGDCGQQTFRCVGGRWQTTGECSCNTITERGGACNSEGLERVRQRDRDVRAWSDAVGEEGLWRLQHGLSGAHTKLHRSVQVVCLV